MLDGLLGVIGTVFGWLGGLLPTSPFSDWMTVTQEMQLGLRWLNWFFPVSEMLVMLVGWIAVVAAVQAVRIALRYSADVAGKVVGQ